MRRGLAIAIDGPAGAGKSTVSEALARATGYEVLDTGAMYRAFTWCLQQQPGLPAAEWAAEVAKHDFRLENGQTWCDDRDISVEIRSAQVTGQVSQVAADPEIRRFAVLTQRRYVDKALSAGRGVILEGRDIGTTVLPEADCKFFLTAQAQRRAERRAAEVSADIAAVAAAIEARDAADSARPVSPLQTAPDAIVIDATDLTVGEVVAAMLAVVEAAAK